MVTAHPHGPLPTKACGPSMYLPRQASLTTPAFTPFTTICTVFPERWTARMCGGARITSLEIPPATLAVGKARLPAAGGGYLRILPLSYSCMAIDQLTRRNLLPVVYMHPWEIDPDQPRLNGTWKSRVRQYWGLESFEPKLHQLLARYQFEPFAIVCRSSSRAHRKSPQFQNWR